MNYRDPQLQARLAGDYVAGLMRGGARRRFEGLMAADAALRREVREWEDRIYPLAWSLPPVTPPRRVWRAIQERVRRTAPKRSWRWDSVLPWRVLSGALALALVVGVTLPLLELEQRGPRPTALAVLATPQEQPVLVVRWDSRGLLHVRALENLSGMSGDKVLELWALPPGQPAQSLGLVAPTGMTTLRLPQGLTGVPQLAVTLEPPGGAPGGKATGPILMSGKVVQI